MKAATVCLCALLLGMAASANAQEAVATFYKGKQIQLIVGTAAGGGYDLTARILARHLGKYIPGNPSIIVQNQNGASSLVMTNYLYNSAARDGTVLGEAINGMPTAPFFEPNAAHFDPTKLSWIGSTNDETVITYVWYTAPVQSLEDLVTKQLIVGANSPGSTMYDVPAIAKSVLGLNFKIISGYEGTPQIHKAMENGEVQGVGGGTWLALKLLNSNWLAEKKVKIVAQWGLRKNRDLPGVPSGIDLATTDESRQALKLVLARQEYGRPFFGPPGIPPDRLRALRRAFDETMKDPEFIEDAHKIELELNPMTGEQVAALVSEVASTPPRIVDRVRKVLQAK